MSCNKPKFAPWPDECIYLFYNDYCNEDRCIHHKYDLKSLVNDLKPLVSILMPYHNSDKTFAKAIKSVIRQTYLLWELIIVDDGSDKVQHKKIQSILHAEVPIEVGNQVKVIHQKHLGQAVARNTAFKNSTGDWIAYLDSDDEWLPNHLTSCLLNLIDNRAELLYADFFYKYYKAHEHAFRITPYVYDEKVINNAAGLLESTNFIAINSVMHSRKAFVLGGGFEPGVVCGEDGVLWRRMVQAGITIMHSGEPTSCYCKYNVPGVKMHQSSILKMPSDIEGKHLIGKGTNGQELDNQEEYNKRFQELKKYYIPGKLNYGSIDE